MAYTPLVLPDMPANPDFEDVSDWLSEVAQQMTDAAQSFVASIADLKYVDFSSVGDLPAFESAVLNGDMSQIFVRPAPRATVNLDVSHLLDRLASLTVPDAPTNTFSYADVGYSSQTQQKLIDKLLYDLNNGGYGIDTNDEAAMWARAKDREASLALANIEEVQRDAAASSFTLPQGVMYNRLQKARQDYMSAVNAMNREISIKRADMFVDNRKFIIEKVLAVEEQTIGLYNAIQNRMLEAAKVEVEIGVKIFEAGVSYFRAQAEIAMKQIEARTDIAKVVAELYAADVRAYAAFVNAVATSAELSIQNTKNVLQRDIEAHKARVDIVKFRLDQLRIMVDNAKDINKFGAEFFRTGMGSSLSNIGGLAVQSGTV